MKLYICANGYTDKQIKQALECVEVLNGLGHTCSIDENPKLSYRNFDPSDSDMIVSLGGDGALLRASKIALPLDKEVIGINSGRLGYLCALSIDEINDFDDILNNCICTSRTVLQFIYKDNIYYSLNDVLISKTNYGKTVDLNVLVDDITIDTVRGDGLLIVTPTGSTAYNISAGGPKIDYDAGVFAITPICCHESVPHIITNDKQITIQVNHDDAGIYSDGELITNIKTEIVVEKADKSLKLYMRK